MDAREAFEIGGQGHVFAFWNELDDREKSSLLGQAEEIDLAELDTLVANLVKGDNSVQLCCGVQIYGHNMIQ